MEGEVATNSTGWFAAAIGGIGAGGLALMHLVRQYNTNRKDNAADSGTTSVYELLTKENKRLSDQMTEVSLLVNRAFAEKLELLGRVGELERKLVVMGDLERENAELRTEVDGIRKENAVIRRENHELRNSVQLLKLKVEQR